MTNGRVRCTSTSVFHVSRFFFKWAAGLDLLGVELEWAPTSAFMFHWTWPSKAPSTSAIDRPRLHACTYRLGDWEKTPDTFFLSFDSASIAARTGFFFRCQSHNELRPNPLPPYESSFVCQRRVKFWDDAKWRLKDVSLHTAASVKSQWAQLGQTWYRETWWRCVEKVLVQRGRERERERGMVSVV